MEELLLQRHAREIERLQNIIDVLLDQNAQQKQLIRHYQQLAAGTTNIQRLITTTDDKGTEMLSAHPGTAKGVKYVSQGYELQTGVPENVSQHTLPQKDGGKYIIRDTPPQTGVPENLPQYTLSQEDEAKRTTRYTLSQED